MESNKAEEYLNDWTERVDLAEQMVPIIGSLYRNQGVNINIYGRTLVNRTPVGILRAHRFARQILDSEISVRDSFPILEAVNNLELAPGKVDIGKLTHRYEQQGNGLSVADFVAKELAEINTGIATVLDEPRDVVLYGFGRIGRLLARILIEQTGGGNKLRVRAAVVRKGSEDDLCKRASLLRRDSVHGRFQGVIKVDEEQNAIIANGNMIKIIYSDAPENIDYTEYGINNAIVIDNTGKWRDREGLGRHLKAKGVSKVILTAPGKGDIPNIVFGVNNELIAQEKEIYSAASCTTNAIVPVLKAVEDKFGIISGHVETCHSYTNDQNLIDNYHNKPRRGRGAPLNMVLTETGAAKAVAKALPELAGKLTGNAIRVPTPNVSMAILNLTLKKGTTVEELNTHLRDVSLDSPLQDQIDYTNSPEVVSSDFVGSQYAGVVDSLATIVDGDRCVLYVWYDNEYGYSCQVVGLLKEIVGLNLPTLPR
ncbi:glyceraldehyde-3-phosphate dehydrogenase [Desulfuromonas acetoxidans]|uniref:Glyceraldehyde-3-phosphate dehydrogenase n=1 Tax=Desulfuromonas acetoxidans (strain DSM 684 / 11070) TaxID=281689 RepID=Q1JW02_DESA6|nr:glyceraldehyde-3-phosphate dehydrogenase [Desulfuromonas acetoxidans]EAT14403.1 glyceraldehyde-3-phosphate dehydrogenase, type I [Desulfuromonas acetoxidans DSM 684]MBF0646563.1 glyceraldehyde-3-phosphate dehydrogenase [Desulfuromonas acetoxidans]NVD25696.1 glyceraldehyde-3-phosphate dehydrogenase [Desulfuromonas acetoxidans]NVE16992.1 glyceraldehyde-3-phosphate dehydrogenase [Desulfuromonas acetoxidans]